MSRKSRVERWKFEGEDPRTIEMLTRFDRIEEALREVKGERFAFAAAHQALCGLLFITVTGIEALRQHPEYPALRSALCDLFAGLSGEVCDFFELDSVEVNTFSKHFDQVITDVLLPRK